MDIGEKKYKRCTVCAELLEATKKNFSKREQSYDKLNYQCKRCVRVKNKAQYRKSSIPRLDAGYEFNGYNGINELYC